MRSYCTRVWAFGPDGRKVFPYTGVRGAKKGLYSVNFSSDTTKFEGLTEEALIEAIKRGRFRDRGTIRMLPLGGNTGDGNNAFAPRFIDEHPIPRRC